MAGITVCIIVVLFLLKVCCQALDWWFGPEKGKAHKRALEEFWYYLEGHTLAQGVSTLLGRMLSRARAAGWRLWAWLLLVSFAINLLGAFVAPFFGNPQHELTFRSFAEYSLHFLTADMGQPLSAIPLRATADAPGYYAVYFWPYLAFTQVLSATGILVSWWALKRVTQSRSALEIALVLTLTVLLVGSFLFATELFHIRVRFRLKPGVHLSLSDYAHLFQIFTTFDLQVSRGLVPLLIWFTSEALPLLLGLTVLGVYFAIWTSPGSVRKALQHMVVRLSDDAGRGKTLLGQASAVLGWLTGILVVVLYLLAGTRIPLR